MVLGGGGRPDRAERAAGALERRGYVRSVGGALGHALEREIGRPAVAAGGKVAECDIAADRAPVGAEDDFAAHQIGLVGILKIAAGRQPVGQAAAIEADRKSTPLNSSHQCATRIPSSA